MASLERIEMKVAPELKADFKKAAALTGKNGLTDYIVSLAKSDAERVIEEHDHITLKNDIFDRFMSACENAAAPNQALKNAALSAKAKGIR